LKKLSNKQTKAKTPTKQKAKTKMTSKHIQIAIDGPAASGKSTTAKMLAQKLDGLYVNTGEMYRTIAGEALRNNIDPDKEPQKLVKLLDGWTLEYKQLQEKQPLVLLFNGTPVDREYIRSEPVANIVSQTAQIPEVRQWMLDKQRDCTKHPLIIMEGRDIGTVVLPNASHKFFITATPEERARRRFAQPGEIQPGTTLEQVAQQIAMRDHIDANRKVAPLKPADDAITIVTDGMTPEQVVDKIIAEINRPRPVEMQYRVPYADTDQMGVVYYANYFVLFERSRNELIRELGATYKQLEDDGLMLPVIEAKATYHRPAKYDDLITVTAQFAKFDGLRLTIKCKVLKEGVLLVEGHTTHVFVKAATGAPTRLQGSLRKLIEDNLIP
jgi:cytidylate kinase